MSKNKKTFKSFIYKYNKILLFVVLLAISFGITLYFASALNNDDNKYTISDVTITSIQDGSGTFDANDSTAGNDSGDNNGIVRTYDTIKYNVTYKLKAKSGENPTLTDDRKIIIDFLIPAKVEGSVNGKDLTTIFTNYSYAEFDVTESVSDENKTLTITLSNINAANNTNINPKIYIREDTDTSMSSLSSMNATTANAISTTCQNKIGENNSCSTKVTGAEDYVINVFKGGTNKNELITTSPIGYMVGLKSEENKGIKGKILPSTVQFSITASPKMGTETIGSDKDEITYGEVSQIITDNLYMCDDCTDRLETVSIDTDTQNGTIDETTQNSGAINIKISNIKAKYIPFASNTYAAFSTGTLTFTSERKSTSVIGDIEISLNAKNNSNTISILDKQNKYIGIYTSRVDIYDALSTTVKESGQAILNNGEDFLINTHFSYGETGGDELDSLTTYIKIDNSAIKLRNFKFGDSDSIPIAASINVGNNNIVPNIDEGDLLFYYGDWTTEYFERTSDADNYNCPTDITSRETLMNLYGGPCIKEKTGKLKSNVDLILTEDTAVSTGLTEEDYNRGPLLVKVRFRSDDTSLIKNVEGNIRLGATVKSSTSLINNEYQIVTSAIGEFTGTNDTSSSSHYLSNVKNSDGTTLITNANNYIKTDYDVNAKKVTTLHRNICNSSACPISGNTIIVSTVRTSKPSINTYYSSSPDAPKDSFYYYPIEWDINQFSGYTSDRETSIRNMTIDLYLPHYLTLTSSEIIVDHNKDGLVGQNTIDISPESTTEVTATELNEIKNSDDSNTDTYYRYRYVIDTDLVGSLTNVTKLKAFTNIKLDTPKNYYFYGYSVIDYSAVANTISSDSTLTQQTFNTIEPIRDRSNYIGITVHNDAAITTQGTLSPRYLEKNEAYTYKMQAYNNSGSTVNNAVLYYVLPYKGDSSYEDLQSTFDATDFKVKLLSLPAGYTAYYNTSGISANIINDELSLSTSDNNTWIRWSDPSTEISEVNAIKIVKDGSLGNHEYFAGEVGITVQVNPVGSNVGDIYYNQFYVITGDNNSKNSYPSSRDKVSIYNRIISGFVWEDYDYNGLFNDEESKLENIPISLYKISDDLENIDANDPTTFVGKEGEEWVSDTITDTNGRYAFIGLTEGKYYAKFTYNDKKYVITKRDATNSDNTPATSVNSKARSYGGGNVAISSIVTFDKLNNSSYDSLNLGLNIRKEFVVDVKNYIKKVTITSDNGTDSYDYDKATTVSITLKNTRNKTARITYDFVVENTKYFPGYVGLIQDITPAGMTFNSNIKENQDWVYSGGVLYYTGLSGKLLVPNEKNYFSLVLDFEITEGGNYINFVSLDNLVLMGDEIPEFDFNAVDTTEQTTEGDNTSTDVENTNNGEGE